MRFARPRRRWPSLTVAYLVLATGALAQEVQSRQLVEEHAIAESVFSQERHEFQIEASFGELRSTRGVELGVEYGITDSIQLGFELRKTSRGHQDMDLSFQKTWLSLGGSGIDVALLAESHFVPLDDHHEPEAYALISRTFQTRLPFQIFGQTRVPLPEFGAEHSSSAELRNSAAEPAVVAGTVLAMSRRARLGHEFAWYESPDEIRAPSTLIWAPSWFWGNAARGQWRLSAYVPLRGARAAGGMVFAYVVEFGGDQ